MGWSGGVYVFDNICNAVMKQTITDESKLSIIKATIETLQCYDWDTESDSDNFHNPIVKVAFCELGYSYWYDDEENV